MTEKAEDEQVEQIKLIILSSPQVPDTIFKQADGVLQGSDLCVPLFHRLHQVAVGLLRLL